MCAAGRWLLGVATRRGSCCGGRARPPAAAARNTTTVMHPLHRARRRSSTQRHACTTTQPPTPGRCPRLARLPPPHTGPQIGPVNQSLLEPSPLDLTLDNSWAGSFHVPLQLSAPQPPQQGLAGGSGPGRPANGGRGDGGPNGSGGGGPGPGEVQPARLAVLGLELAPDLMRRSLQGGCGSHDCVGSHDLTVCTARMRGLWLRGVWSPVLPALPNHALLFSVSKCCRARGSRPPPGRQGNTQCPPPPAMAMLPLRLLPTPFKAAPPPPSPPLPTGRLCGARRRQLR